MKLNNNQKKAVEDTVEKFKKLPSDKKQEVIYKQLLTLSLGLLDEHNYTQNLLRNIQEDIDEIKEKMNID